MKTATKITGIAALALTFSLPAFAGNYGHRASYDYAQVIKVKPLYETIRVDHPQRECWTEHVTRYKRGTGHSATPEIVGGLIGAAVGREFGRGRRARNVGTLLGAVLGGSIAHDIKRRHAKPGYSYTEPVQRCETRHAYSHEERIVGYKVKYRYNGRIYHTRTDYDPGDSIRVQVNVSPVL